MVQHYLGSRSSSLPTGTVTFLFSDIEGSTRLAESQAHLSEAIELLDAVADVHATFRVTVIAAAVAVAQGDSERAARLSGAGSVLRAPLGDIATPSRCLGSRIPWRRRGPG